MERFERYAQGQHRPGRLDLAGADPAQYLDDQPLRRPEVVFRATERPGTVRAAIFQLQQNGAPGFMRPFMTDDGRKANISFFYPDHKGETIMYATHSPASSSSRRTHSARSRSASTRTRPQADAELLRLREAAGHVVLHARPAPSGVAAEPHPRTSASAGRGRQLRESARRQLRRSGEDLPEWLGEFREAARSTTTRTLGTSNEGEVFTWPESLADWESPPTSTPGGRTTSRAFARSSVNTKDLIVADMKAVDSAPKYQPTNSWTRGVQFVMAGGIMGILAAINDEVERSHVANISLIFLVIFVLHSVTYQSMPSGGIILLQIATATMVSLAYMAMAGSRAQHQHPARAVGGRRHRRRLRDLHRGPHPPGGRRHRGHRRGRAAGRAHHGHGGDLHRHHDRRAASSCGCSRTCASRPRWPSCWSS